MVSPFRANLTAVIEGGQPAPRPIDKAWATRRNEAPSHAEAYADSHDLDPTVVAEMPGAQGLTIEDFAPESQETAKTLFTRATAARRIRQHVPPHVERFHPIDPEYGVLMQEFLSIQRSLATPENPFIVESALKVLRRLDTEYRESSRARKIATMYAMLMAHIQGRLDQLPRQARHLSDRDEDEAHRKAWETRHANGEGQDEPTQSEMRPATDGDKDRMKALKVPPAWKEVHLSADPKSALQATGIDAKGRKQYLYSAEHSARQAAEKFDRLKAFHKALPDIREKIAGDLATSEEAAVLYLIDKTGFRIGGDDETGADVQAYGASTLRSKHVSVNGDSVRFKFVGKKGVEIVKKVKDAKLAEIMTMRKERIGRGRGPLFDTTDGKVRGYLKEIAPDFKVKDFRTYAATSIALREVEKVRRIPSSESAYKKAQREVAKAVASALGNTPAVALKSYIDPAVFRRWQVAA